MTRFSRFFVSLLTPSNRDRAGRPRPLTLVLSVALSTGAFSAVSADTWTHVSGEKTIEAKFVGVMGERAILELPGGERSAVALRDLQYESRQRALDMEQARQKHMAEVSSELERAVEKELEAAPKRIPPPETASPEFEPLPDDATLEQTAQHVAGQLQAGHVRALWDALPPSYQSDIEEVVAEFAHQMDPVVWQDILSSVIRTTELLASRERWIFSYPALEEIAADNSVRDGYRAVLGALQTVFDPEVLTLQRLKEGNLEELIAERDALLAAYLTSAEILDGGASEMDLSLIEVEMIDETRGTVTIQPPRADEGRGPGEPGPDSPPQTSPDPYSMPSPTPESYSPPGAPQDYSMQGSSSPTVGEPEMFVLVEGHWVPEAMAKDWDQQIESLKAKIKNEMPAQIAALRPQVTAFEEMVDQYVGPLEEAGSEAEFHAAIDRMAFQAAGYAMQAFGMMNQANRSGGGSFGSAMGMEDYGPEMNPQPYSQPMETYGGEGDGGTTQSNAYGIEVSP